MEQAIATAREETEGAERRAVAAEVDQLVRASGLSRAEFASRIGTSASRLSTYATGKVTPSAALLVRMRRTIDHEHSHPQRQRRTRTRRTSPPCDAGPRGTGAIRLSRTMHSSA